MGMLSPKGFNPLKKFSQSILLKQTAGLLGGLGLLSSGLVWQQNQAQANTDIVIGETKPAAETPNSIAAPVITPKPVVQPQPVVPLQPKTFKIEPQSSTFVQPEAPKPKVQLSAPKISTSESATLKRNPNLIIPQEIQNQVISNGEQAVKNSYIDTANYGTNYTPPSAVVLTERGRGCQLISQNGQLSQCGTTEKKQPSLANRNNNTSVAKRPTPTRNLITASKTNSVRIVQPIAIQPPRVNQGASLQPQRIAANQVVSLKPIEMNGVKIALAPVPRYNRATVMGLATLPQTRKTDLLYPLSIPAQITSVFGWRQHPIAGTGRMHEGTDIGAPMGTPVLAAYEGEVAVADWVGGYGLMVVLRHLDGSQESRYAHLSEIYVQPGEKVAQGTVIGRVGSTGFSTGPHLHFEWRHLTAQGWVAVDAGLHLQYALENLIQSLQTAKVTSQQDG